MRPVIMLTHKYAEEQGGHGRTYKLQENYCRALSNAGALPIIHGGGAADDAAALADAVLFTGGIDIDPLRYGEENLFDIKSDGELDKTEFELFEAFLKAGKPIFGICRGLQLINAAMGGSLYQHVPGQLSVSAHKAVYEEGKTEHPVSAVAGSTVERLFGGEFTVNSYHHQAVKTLGQGLRPAAVTDEGLIEAVEHETLPILAVQWHPERMFGGESGHMPDMSPLFRYFTALCEKNR